jgi:GTP-binding protein SAR1
MLVILANHYSPQNILLYSFRGVIDWKCSIHNIRLKRYLQARRLWRDYFPEVSGIVYLVDSADPGSFLESKTELDALLSLEQMERIPFLILGNKLDAVRAVSEHRLRQELDIYQCTGKVKF